MKLWILFLAHNLVLFLLSFSTYLFGTFAFISILQTAIIRWCIKFLQGNVRSPPYCSTLPYGFSIEGQLHSKITIQFYNLQRIVTRIYVSIDSYHRNRKARRNKCNVLTLFLVLKKTLITVIRNHNHYKLLWCFFFFLFFNYI